MKSIKPRPCFISPGKASESRGNCGTQKSATIGHSVQREPFPDYSTKGPRRTQRQSKHDLKSMRIVWGDLASSNPTPRRQRLVEHRELLRPSDLSTPLPTQPNSVDFADSPTPPTHLTQPTTAMALPQDSTPTDIIEPDDDIPAATHDYAYGYQATQSWYRRGGFPIAPPLLEPEDAFLKPQPPAPAPSSQQGRQITGDAIEPEPAGDGHLQDIQVDEAHTTPPKPTTQAHQVPQPGATTGPLQSSEPPTPPENPSAAPYTAPEPQVRQRCGKPLPPAPSVAVTYPTTDSDPKRCGP